LFPKCKGRVVLVVPTKKKLQLPVLVLIIMGVRVEQDLKFKILRSRAQKSPAHLGLCFKRALFYKIT